MMLIGMVLFAAAVVVVAVVMTQNRTAVLDVHAFGYTWHAHAISLIAFGIVATVIAAAGIRWMQVAAIRAALRKTAATRGSALTSAAEPHPQGVPMQAPVATEQADEPALARAGRPSRTSFWSRGR